MIQKSVHAYWRQPCSPLKRWWYSTPWMKRYMHNLAADVWRSCIKGQPHTPAREIRRATLNEIVRDTLRFRKKQLDRELARIGGVKDRTGTYRP